MFYSQTRVIKPSEKILYEQRVIIGADGNQSADAYRFLRTQVMQTMSRNGDTVLGITSPVPGEGKSFTAVNLALSMSLDPNHTVLLVDLDLRHPSIHQKFGIKPLAGLSDYLTGDVEVSQCLVNPGFDRLVILPGGDPLPTSSEAVISRKMAGLAEELKTRYPDRLIIYDLPPLLVTGDAVSFLSHVDCCLLVVRAGATRKREIERSMGLLDGHKLLGTVLNDIDGIVKGDRGHHYY